MTNTSKYCVVFLVLMCALLGGCGPAFTGDAPELEAGAAGDDSGAAGSSAAGTGGSPSAGSGGTAGESGAGGLAGAAGAAGGAAGSSSGRGGAPSTGGAAGGGPPKPSCSPDEAVLDAIQLGDQLQLDGYSWTDGLHCAACPEGGCGACQVETVYHRTLTDTSREVVVTLSCALALEAGLCGEEVHCTQEPNGSKVLSIIVDLTPDPDGYVMAVLPNRASTMVASDFYCGPSGYGDGNMLSNAWLQSFTDLIEGSTLRCESAQ